MGRKPLIIAAFALSTMACLGLAQTAKPSTDKWEAPADAAAKPNPEAQNPDAPAVGHKLYMRTPRRRFLPVM